MASVVPSLHVLCLAVLAGMVTTPGKVIRNRCGLAMEAGTLSAQKAPKKEKGQVDQNHSELENRV